MSTRKILIIGATGPTGRHVLDLALKSGDTVTVLARRPEALEDVKDNITVIAGDATSREDVAKAMQGQEAVIATLGTGGSSGSCTWTISAPNGGTRQTGSVMNPNATGQIAADGVFDVMQGIPTSETTSVV